MRWLFISAVLMGAVALAADLTVEEIVAKNAKALGGDHWSKISTMKITGTYTAFSRPEPFTIYRKRPNLYRFDHIQNKRDVSRVYDGKMAWWINPWYDHKVGTPIPEPDNLETIWESDFAGALMDYAKKGFKVSLVGKTDLEGAPHYEIKLVRAEGVEETWYINCETFLTTQVVGTGYDFGEKHQLVTYFDDYREVGGVKLPFYSQLEFGSRYRIFELDKVEINVDIPDSLFIMPKTEEKKKTK